MVTLDTWCPNPGVAGVRRSLWTAANLQLYPVSAAGCLKIRFLFLWYNTMTKNNLGRKGFLSVYSYSPSRDMRAGSDAEAMETVIGPGITSVIRQCTTDQSGGGHFLN